MKYRGVIFDLDGVICFTDRYHYQAWKQIADELGIPFDEKKNDLLRGIGRTECLEILLGSRTAEFTQLQKEELAERKNALYRGYLSGMTPEDVTKNVLQTLQALKAQGIAMAIGSVSKNTRYILERLGLTEMFDVVIDGNVIVHSKPDPEVFLKAAEQMKLLPKECVVVEDAAAGIEAARRGGFVRLALGSAVAETDAEYHSTSVTTLLTIQ